MMDSKFYSITACVVLAGAFFLTGDYNIANIYIAAILILTGITDK
jgi:hypothetical protein